MRGGGTEVHEGSVPGKGAGIGDFVPGGGRTGEQAKVCEVESVGDTTWWNRGEGDEE